jgi:hypothetical protein
MTLAKFGSGTTKIDQGRKGGPSRPPLGKSPGGHDGGKKDASRRGVK